MRIILYIIAAILIFFGVLFIWGAFDPTAPDGWLFVGIISVGIGLALIWFAQRRKAGTGAQSQNITLNIDLPANVSVDQMKCKSCGGALTMENIKMIAGAPVVTCPYCHTTYQLTEDPKW